MSRGLKILISGTRDDMRDERTALARALRSLRLDGAHIDDKYSDARMSHEATMALIYECDIYVGVYNKTHYGSTDPAADVSHAEQEFDEAQRLQKPQLIFVRQLLAADQPDARQLAFVERVINVGDKNVRVSEFSDAADLEDLAAESLLALIPERFGLRVTRPIFQAPSFLETFVGREPQIEKLMNAIGLGRTILIHGVGDVGGTGKSELAIYAAHHLREQFPDGVVWADVKTARPSDLLVTWARAFGGFPSLGRGDLRFEYRGLTVEERRISEITLRANETRRVLSGKRVLAILDGVIDDQDDIKIAPLVQALGECAVIVTSRTRRLPSLKANTLIELERMNGNEAWSLFARILGTDRLEDQRALIAEIVQVVDALPLGIDLAATLLREHHPMTLQRLFEILRAERESLEATESGYRSMRGMLASINANYAFLSEDDKKFFAALGVFAGDDFDAEAAASVADTSPYVAARTLEQLTRRSLVQDRRRPGCYKLHPVLRSYARDKLQDQEAELRMAKYYCGVVKEHGRKLLGAETHSAHAVLTAELSNIFAAYNFAERRNDRVGWELCRDFVHGGMTYYFNLHAMWSDWVTWCQAGLEGCQKLGDERSAVSIAGSLGMVYQRKGDAEQAIEFYRNAVGMMERLGNFPGLAAIYMNLGTVYSQKEEWSQAMSALSKSLLIREKINDIHGMAQTRANLGMLYAKHGERVKARALWMQALEVFDSLGSRNEADIVRKWLKGLPPQSR